MQMWQTQRYKKKFMTIWQILVARPKLWKNLYFYKKYIFNVKILFFLAEKWKNALSHPKNCQFEKKSLKKSDTLFARWYFFDMFMFKKAKGLKICKTIQKNCVDWGFLLIDEKMCLVRHCNVKKNPAYGRHQLS